MSQHCPEIHDVRNDARALLLQLASRPDLAEVHYYTTPVTSERGYHFTRVSLEALVTNPSSHDDDDDCDESMPAEAEQETKSGHKPRLRPYAGLFRSPPGMAG